MRRAGTWLLLAALLACVVPARAEVLKAGSTSGAESTPLFLAVQEGIFARHGLDVEVVIVPLMPNLPAAVLSDSLQVGSMVSTTFLQAAVNGVDLVTISGGSVTSPQADNIALLVAPQSGIRTPLELVGRKVGMPGLGAFMHVTLRWWLNQKGVDWHQVDFVETTFPTMRDLLRAGTVDAVGAIDPFARGIVDSGAGEILARFQRDMPAGKPSVLYAARREWVAAHPAQVAAFREAVREAIGIVGSDPARGRRALGAYVKLPPEVLATTSLGVYDPVVTPDGLGWWLEVMKAQDMVGEAVDPAGLIAP